MGTARFAHSLLVFAFFGVFGFVGCGAQTSAAGRTEGTGGTFAAYAGTGGMGLSGAGGAAAAGIAGASNAVCPEETALRAPFLSANCEVSVRDIDPALVCDTADCAITKALDLSCATKPHGPQIFATADGATLSAAAEGSNSRTVSRLMTVEAATSRVQDLPSSGYVGSPSHVYFVDPNGDKWLFGVTSFGIGLLRESNGGWTSSTVISSSDSSNDSYPADAVMVDGSRGYLTYYVGSIWEPHLVTWDGSCWTDELIGPSHMISIVLGTDAQDQPWVAWLSREYPDGSSLDWLLYLRDPNGGTQRLDVTADPPQSSAPLRLLAGGLDGNSASPALAARFSDGIRVLSPSATADAGWSSRTLAESAMATTRDGDCPSMERSMDYGGHCLGMTTCTAQFSGVGTGFDLVRTQSGAVFAAWVTYSSQGTYALEEASYGSEMPEFYCDRTETSGSGTADLVLARLTASEPILTRFHFAMGGAITSLSNNVVMAARGDTLLVGAHLNGQAIPTLTYLEIDSNLLP